MIQLDKSEIREKTDTILAKYQGRRDELIPILNETQRTFNYLPKEAMEIISRFLRVSQSTIYGVATFYALFRLTPSGRKIIQVCRGTACHVRGSSRLIDEIEQQLGIRPGDTTDDLEYTLETVSCFGSCALAPVMVVDKTVYGRMTPAKVREILGKGK